MNVRTLCRVLALLFALVLTVQGFASVPRCAGDPAAAAHCAHGSAQSHHGCDGCCLAAPAVSALPWEPPPRISPTLTLIAAAAPPSLAAERLDRPPRLAPA